MRTNKPNDPSDIRICGTMFKLSVMVHNASAKIWYYSPGLLGSRRVQRALPVIRCFTSSFCARPVTGNLCALDLRTWISMILKWIERRSLQIRTRIDHWNPIHTSCSCGTVFCVGIDYRRTSSLTHFPLRHRKCWFLLGTLLDFRN